MQTLVSTQQQQVIVENGYVEVLPAQPNVIYVPYYDPDVVYVRRDYEPEQCVTFSEGYGAGVWLDLGVDWHSRRIDRDVRWNDDWRHPDYGRARQWEHDRDRPIPRPQFSAERPHGVQPSNVRAGAGERRPLPPSDPRVAPPKNSRGAERPAEHGAAGG